ncbi:MAG: AtpZ/AtpI family protein [Thermodesulfobacteriota bacterium]
MSKNRKEALKMLTDFSTLGLTVAGCVVIGLAIGRFLDHRVFDDRTSPWFTMIFLAFGIIAAFKNMYQMTKRKDL